MYKFYEYVGSLNDYEECKNILKRVKKKDVKKKFDIQFFPFGKLVFRIKNDTRDCYVVETTSADTSLFRADIYPVGDVNLTQEQFMQAIECLVYDEYKESVYTW